MSIAPELTDRGTVGDRHTRADRRRRPVRRAPSRLPRHARAAGGRPRRLRGERMATPELTPRRQTGRRRRPAGSAQAWLRAYAARMGDHARRSRTARAGGPTLRIRLAGCWGWHSHPPATLHPTAGTSSRWPRTTSRSPHGRCCSASAEPSASRNARRAANSLLLACAAREHAPRRRRARRLRHPTGPLHPAAAARVGRRSQPATPAGPCSASARRAPAAAHMARADRRARSAPPRHSRRSRCHTTEQPQPEARANRFTTRPK